MSPPPLQRLLVRIAQAGALELEGAELRFETSADGDPTRVEAKADLRTMSIVAELMIFANSAVAEKITGTFPGAALLRRHPPPRKEAFESVRARCSICVRREVRIGG